MKVLIIIVLMFIGSATTAQIEPTTPDKPSGYTENYGFRLYESGSYPGADSLNQNIIDIDHEIKKTRQHLYILFFGLVSTVFIVGLVVLKKDENSR